MTAKLLIVLLLVIIGTMLAAFRDGLTPRIQTYFFLRYELLLLGSPVLLVLLAWLIPSVLQNLFILTGIRDGMFVAFFSYGSAWIALPLTITVLDRAGERSAVQYHAPVWFWDWAIFLYAIPPTILILDAACHSPVYSYPGILGGALVAWIAALQWTRLLAHCNWNTTVERTLLEDVRWNPMNGYGFRKILNKGFGGGPSEPLDFEAPSPRSSCLSCMAPSDGIKQVQGGFTSKSDMDSCDTLSIDTTAS
jgi:hypothetical protein